jgi:DNA modification methylase
MPSESIDLVVTSPPYDDLRTYSAGKSMAELWEFERVAQQLWRVIKPGGVVVWVVADATINGSETGTSFRQALRFMEIGFRLHDTMIYKVPGTGAKGSNYAYWQEFEFMFVLAKGQPKAIHRLTKRNKKAGSVCTSGTIQARTGTRLHPVGGTVVQEFGVRGNVWEYLSGNNGDEGAERHPAPFPEALARDHILSWSNEGDIVLDPFAGSFTTCKMAKLMGRRWIGIEANPDYCEIGRNRLAQGVLF